MFKHSLDDVAAVAMEANLVDRKSAIRVTEQRRDFADAADSARTTCACDQSSLIVPKR